MYFGCIHVHEFPFNTLQKHWFRLHMEQKLEKMVVTAYNNLLLSDALSRRKTRIVVPNN